MAEKSESQLSPVQVREKVERSREELGRDLAGLRYELDFSRKIKRTFQRNTAVWVGGALAVGLLLALMRARTKKVYINTVGKKVRSPNKSLLESGALLGLVKIGMTIFQPMVVSYFAKKGAKQGERRERRSSSW
jgi:hypothetical protein